MKIENIRNIIAFAIDNAPSPGHGQLLMATLMLKACTKATKGMTDRKAQIWMDSLIAESIGDIGQVAETVKPKVIMPNKPKLDLN